MPCARSVAEGLGEGLRAFIAPFSNAVSSHIRWMKIVMLNQPTSISALWRCTPVVNPVFRPELLRDLPTAVQRYLKHAIALGTPLATAVRLKMHGEIKLNGWQAFRAEQVICPQQGMIWQAQVWVNGLPVWGWDCLVAGEGTMQWKLLGLLPVMVAKGTDITQSAIGRMQGECIWLPSVLCDRTVTWQAPDSVHACATLTHLGQTTDLMLQISQTGQLVDLCFKRWGNPDGGPYRYVDFGAVMENEGTFAGYTIPTQLRAGWYFDSDRFESEGEFFRVTIDEAIYQ